MTYMFLSSEYVNFCFTLVIRMILACILGGLIGYERESMNRPAGFRTHILVCIGSAIVMVTSEFIFHEYRSLTNMDPARLGAQVISGIGFLGAGTIIREGFNVRGLTTAASLWAVSCVGIAAGIGFYEGAILGTLLIYITLIMLKNLEKYFSKKEEFTNLYIKSKNIPGQLAHISSIIAKHKIHVKNIEFINDESDENLMIKILIKVHNLTSKSHIIEELQSLTGIQKVYEDE